MHQMGTEMAIAIACSTTLTGVAWDPCLQLKHRDTKIHVLRVRCPEMTGSHIASIHKRSDP